MAKTICFYPHVPGRSSKLRKYAEKMNLKIGSLKVMPEAEAFMFWKYAAYHDRDDPHLATAIRAAADSGIPVYNLGAVDVRKQTVDRYFEARFGRSALIQSDILMRGRGVCVEKGEGQCTKDGRILALPLRHLESGKVYMKFIDTRRPGSGGLFNVDIRIPYFRGDIPFVILKWKKAIFKRGEWAAEFLEDPILELTLEEIRKTVAMMKAIGIDYAEIDALRNSDGDLYIIDVNPTPGTMGGIWNPDHRHVWEKRYITSFREAFIPSFT